MRSRGIAWLFVGASIVLPFLVHFGCRIRSPIYMIPSQSMSPALRYGDLVLVVPVAVDDVQRGDIVVFRCPTGPELKVAHRVMGTDRRGGTITLKTKGDANPVEDDWIVVEEDIIGKVILTIPRVGYAVAFLRSQIGMAVLLMTGLLLLGAMIYEQTTWDAPRHDPYRLRRGGSTRAALKGLGKKILWNDGAVSPIVSLLITVAIALVVGFGAYTWMTGMVSAFKPESLQVTAYMYPANHCDVYIRNQGASGANVSAIKYRDITDGGILTAMTYADGPFSIGPGAAVSKSCTMPEADYEPGHVYEIVVITSKNQYSARTAAE